ncbi:hypothetical protein SAMN06298216_2406 [Spirosomataceae bacterium TFI 002]|nr:hypothetical protein SAMN06298216_2406 [Spirosomataceae bacterium TFI 002]
MLILVIFDTIIGLENTLAHLNKTCSLYILVVPINGLKRQKLINNSNLIIMKKILLLTFCTMCISIGFAQNHTIHNNTSTILITPGAITSNHPSELSGTNQNLSIGKDALPNAPSAAGLSQGNLAVGENALFTNASASKNIAVGLNALKLNNDGGNNLAIGVDALSSNNTGTTNIAIGNNALKTSNNANQNIAIGMNSLQSATTGYKNISIGENSGSATLTGFSNIGIGVNSMKTINGSNNIALGEMSLGTADVGIYNPKARIVAIGNETFSQTTNGSNSSVAIGHMAGRLQGYAIQDVYIGAYAGGTGTSVSSNNTAVGFEALQKSTFNNIAVGYQAGKNASGGQNTFIGIGSGQYSPSNFNTLVGYQSGLSLSGEYNAAFGYHSLRNLNSGVHNASIGGFILRNTTSASRNSIVGSYALASNTSTNVTKADSNVVLGYASLYVDTNPSSSLLRNVAIGHEAGRWNTSLSDKLIIDNSKTTTPLVGGDFAANKVGINRLYTDVPTDPSTLQVGGGIGIPANAQMSFGLDADAGYASISNTSSGIISNLVFKTGNQQRMEINAGGLLKISTVPIYADNAAAIAGGLQVGHVYRTATGVMMIRY